MRDNRIIAWQPNPFVGLEGRLTGNNASFNIDEGLELYSQPPKKTRKKGYTTLSANISYPGGSGSMNAAEFIGTILKGPLLGKAGDDFMRSNGELLPQDIVEILHGHYLEGEVGDLFHRKDKNPYYWNVHLKYAAHEFKVTIVDVDKQNGYVSTYEIMIPAKVGKEVLFALDSHLSRLVSLEDATEGKFSDTDVLGNYAVVDFTRKLTGSSVPSFKKVQKISYAIPMDILFNRLKG